MQRIKAWAGAVIWMGVIFAMSAMPGDVSGQQSGTLVQLLLGAVSFLLGEETAAAIPPEMIHLIIRKGAHMAEYAVLFFLYHRALKAENVSRPGLCALILCALYAATDEMHQGFVAGRGPSAADVGIDTLGAGIAWGITALYAQINNKER